MRSIRRGLTLSLLCGLAILWLVAGAGIYFSVHHSLIKSLDAELALHARLVRFAARGDEDPPDNADNRAGARRLQDRIRLYKSNKKPGLGSRVVRENRTRSTNRLVVGLFVTGLRLCVHGGDCTRSAVRGQPPIVKKLYPVSRITGYNRNPTPFPVV
jgi:hypothetical protein